MTDVQTTHNNDKMDKVREEAHKKNLDYDPTKPKETDADKRLKELNKRREEEYKRDAADSKKHKQDHLHVPEPKFLGPSQEEIESPVQAMRDPREDLYTTNVDSDGDKLQRRGGLPATLEERKAWGDKLPDGPSPFTGGVPGSHHPGEVGPSLDERAKEAEQLQAQREGRPVTSQPQPGANVAQANKAAEKKDK